MKIELKIPTMEDKDGEIGYLLLTDYWSKGIMTGLLKEKFDGNH
jgi:RimJ/RimL family protein N-acetyltransferase